MHNKAKSPAKNISVSKSGQYNLQMTWNGSKIQNQGLIIYKLYRNVLTLKQKTWPIWTCSKINLWNCQNNISHVMKESQILIITELCYLETKMKISFWPR